MRPQETSAIFIHPLGDFQQCCGVRENACSLRPCWVTAREEKWGFSPQLLSDSVAYVGLNTGKRSQ